MKFLKFKLISAILIFFKIVNDISIMLAISYSIIMKRKKTNNGDYFSFVDTIFSIDIGTTKNILSVFWKHLKMKCLIGWNDVILKRNPLFWFKKLKCFCIKMTPFSFYWLWKLQSKSSNLLYLWPMMSLLKITSLKSCLSIDNATKVCYNFNKIM